MSLLTSKQRRINQIEVLKMVQKKFKIKVEKDYKDYLKEAQNRDNPESEYYSKELRRKFNKRKNEYGEK